MWTERLFWFTFQRITILILLWSQRKCQCQIRHWIKGKEKKMKNVQKCNSEKKKRKRNMSRQRKNETQGGRRLICFVCRDSSSNLHQFCGFQFILLRCSRKPFALCPDHFFFIMQNAELGLKKSLPRHYNHYFECVEDLMRTHNIRHGVDRNAQEQNS